MSNYQLTPDIKVSIPKVLNEENVIYYLILVQVDNESIHWEVQRRYSDFAALHEQLVDDGIDRDLLPPKKLLGNKDPAFLMKRRKELESYLQSIFHFLVRNIPEPLAHFLDFNKYDIHFILRNLADECYQREVDLTGLSLEQDEPDQGQPSSPYHPEWTPLELYSLNQRLKHPCPPTDTESKRHDFTNVVDLCCRLEELTVRGGSGEVGASNIQLHNLKFDFLAFKSLQRLHLDNLDISQITSLGILRSTLVELTARSCSLCSVSDILLCDTPHSNNDADLSDFPSLTWTSLLLLDLSDNSLEGLDRSIRLAPRIETLVINNNSISAIEHLTGLPHLRRLSLAHNKIKLNQDLHVVMGQVTHIDLSYNKISSLNPFRKLYSLQELNVEYNRLEGLDSVSCVSSLPCLENINFTGNRVTTQVDYRLKILEAFGSRCREIVLDGELPTPAELDKVSVLMALRVKRENKSPTSLFGNLPNAEQWKT